MEDVCNEQTREKLVLPYVTPSQPTLAQNKARIAELKYLIGREVRDSAQHFSQTPSLLVSFPSSPTVDFRDYVHQRSRRPHSWPLPLHL